MIDLETMTKEEFKELLYKAYRMELEDDQDVTRACLLIHVSVKHLLMLLKFPEMRPLQKKYEEILTSSQSLIIPSQFLAK